MTVWLLTMVMMSLITSLIISSNPLTMGLTILLSALVLTMIFASVLSSWFAFLIFLIYVGGMLIMFAYFMALMPNQELFINSLLILSSFMFFLSIFYNLHSPSSFSSDLSLSTLYMKKNEFILIILAFALLYAMIIVVKMTTITKGPLRPFM